MDTASQTSFEKSTVGDKATVADLLARRDDLYHAIELVNSEVEKQVTPKLGEALDQIIDQYNDDDRDEIEILLQYGRLVIPAELYENLTQLKHLAEQEAANEAELDAIAGEPLLLYVKHEAEQLLDAVVVGRLHKNESIYSDDDRTSIRDAMYALRECADTTDVSYRLAESLHDMVEKSRDTLDDLNMLIDPAAELSGDTEEQVAAHGILQLERALTLNNRYRNYHKELYVEQALDKPMLPGHEWQVTMNDEQRQALENHLQAIDVTKEFEHLTIEGLELLPFSYSKERLRALLYQVPAIAFEGVRQLTFKRIDSDFSEPITEDGMTTLGHHAFAVQNNSAEIVIWLDPIESICPPLKHGVPDFWDLADDRASRSAGAVSVATELMEGSILHEFGHAFHHTLPVSMLHEWDEVVCAASEDEPVTTYVKRMRDLAHSHYEKEDFAESFQLYLTQPGDLFKQSERRFDAMHQLFKQTQLPGVEVCTPDSH